jgi:hypothetical protein
MEQQVKQPLALQPSIPLRLLGAVEQYFWLSDQNSPKHFCMTLQVSGETTVEAWRHALDAVQFRHPLLRSTIARNELGVPCFYVRDDRQIPLQVIRSEPPHAWQRVVSGELMKPFEQTDAPLIRAVLSHSPRYATLVLTAHHAVADGMSIAFVLRDMLEVMSGGHLGQLDLAFAQETIALEWDMSPVGTAQSAAAIPARMLDRSKGCPVISSLQLSQEFSVQLRVASRRQTTTVHGVLLSAIILAGRRLSQEWRDTTIRAVSPVNLRPTLGINDDCVVAIIFPIGGYAPDNGTEVWDLARDIRQDLTPMKTREAIVESFGAFQRIFEALPSVEELAAIELEACACEMMLSNLGEAPLLDEYGPVHVEALWGPSVFVGIEGEQMVGAATVGGRIHLLHTSFTPIPGLLEAAEELLREAIARS